MSAASAFIYLRRWHTLILGRWHSSFAQRLAHPANNNHYINRLLLMMKINDLYPWKQILFQPDMLTMTYFLAVDF